MDENISFILSNLTSIIDERIQQLTQKRSIQLVKSANVVSVQTTTLTIRFDGDTADITGVPFLAGQTISAGNNVMVFQNGSRKSSSWLAIKPAQ